MDFNSKKFVVTETFFEFSQKTLSSFHFFFQTHIFIYLSIVPLRLKTDIQLIVFVLRLAIIYAHDTHSITLFHSI